MMRPFIAHLDLEAAPFKDLRAELLRQFEHWYIHELMAYMSGNVARAAQRAEVDRAYIYKLMRRYGATRAA